MIKLNELKIHRRGKSSVSLIARENQTGIIFLHQAIKQQQRKHPKTTPKPPPYTHCGWSPLEGSLAASIKIQGMYTLDLGNPLLGSILEKRLPRTRCIISDSHCRTRAVGQVNKSEKYIFFIKQLSWHSVLRGNWKYKFVKIFD